MPKTYVNPPVLFNSRQYGFSQVVTNLGGTTVYLSGQVGWDAEESFGESRDFAAQMRRALENIEAALEAVGGTRDDVVALRIYLVGVLIYDTRTVREALLAFFDPERQPATTWLGVTALASRDLLVEIEATAVVE
jgi:2-iminobutanoate/2-iminopropanoate deaminase